MDPVGSENKRDKIEGVDSRYNRASHIKSLERTSIWYDVHCIPVHGDTGGHQPRVHDYLLSLSYPYTTAQCWYKTLTMLANVNTPQENPHHTHPSLTRAWDCPHPHSSTPPSPAPSPPPPPPAQPPPAAQHETTHPNPPAYYTHSPQQPATTSYPTQPQPRREQPSYSPPASPSARVSAAPPKQRSPPQ